jgi:hypothetical protein
MSSAFLFSSDLPSLFYSLLGILKNMSSPVSTDVKEGWRLFLLKRVKGVGGWVRRVEVRNCCGVVGRCHWNQWTTGKSLQGKTCREEFPVRSSLQSCPAY